MSVWRWAVSMRWLAVNMRWLAAGVLVGAVLTGCGEDPTLPADAPEGHTVNQDGVAHMPGLSDPLAVCTECHGADLRGGASGEPSCYACHGRKW